MFFALPKHTESKDFKKWMVGFGFTFTYTLSIDNPQPFILATTTYIPESTNFAFLIIGLEIESIKLLGPVHLYLTFNKSVACNCISEPKQEVDAITGTNATCA